MECAKDSVWGCGVALQDEKCLIRTEWTTKGIMGEILEEIREELSHLKGDCANSPTDTSDTSSQSSSSDESGDDSDNTSIGNPEPMTTETPDVQ